MRQILIRIAVLQIIGGIAASNFSSILIVRHNKFLIERCMQDWIIELVRPIRCVSVLMIVGVVVAVIDVVLMILRIG